MTRRPLAESALAPVGQSVRVLVWDRDLVHMWCLGQGGRREPFPGKGSQWHCHADLELTVITAGDGVLHVGDHIGRFRAPDCILVGSGVPHAWRSHGALSGVSLQFRHDGVDGLGSLVELCALAALWRKARFGIRWQGATGKRLREQMLALEGRPALDRLARFLLILETMRGAAKTHARTLSEQVVVVGDAQHPDPGMQRVLDHIMANFRADIHLDGLVAMSGRSQATFCRHFPALTGRTFTAYLNAIRIQEASRRLVDSGDRITAIAFAAGFSNLSHFHAVFRRATGCTPREFRNLGGQSAP